MDPSELSSFNEYDVLTDEDSASPHSLIRSVHGMDEDCISADRISADRMSADRMSADRDSAVSAPSNDSRGYK